MQIATSYDHKDLDGRSIAHDIIADVKNELEALKTNGWGPKLISITVGDTNAVAVYVHNQMRTAERAGINFEERNYPADISETELNAALGAMNADPTVTGIILQRPVPSHLNIKKLQSAIHPLKDVEGMHPTSIGNIVYNQLDLAPCTAAASVTLLKHTGLRLEGLEVTVVGHSEIVGKPIAFLLMSEGCTVTVCHHMTRNLAIHSRQADAVLVAVGKPGLITGDMIKPGAAVIDIGINQVKDNSGSARIVGDVDYESCRPVAGWITPVPGGVGPVTVATLMRNTLVAAKRQRQHYEAEFAKPIVL